MSVENEYLWELITAYAEALRSGAAGTVVDALRRDVEDEIDVLAEQAYADGYREGAAAP